MAREGQSATSIGLPANTRRARFRHRKRRGHREYSGLAVEANPREGDFAAPPADDLGSVSNRRQAGARSRRRDARLLVSDADGSGSVDEWP